MPQFIALRTSTMLVENAKAGACVSQCNNTRGTLSHALYNALTIEVVAATDMLC